jgi:tetratricopeptide (TPR) repeat protein
MAQRIARFSLTFLLALTLIVPPPAVMACGEGPESAESIFIQSDRPDLPFDTYAAGELGIVQPGYDRSYLVVAYRYFSGKAFDASEQAQLVALWNHYLNNEDHGPQVQAGAGEAEWNAALQDVAQIKVPDNPQLSAHDRFVLATYQSYTNCLDDAYHTAAKTLKERAQQFGPRSAAVQSWVGAQQTVFHNCDAGSGSIPNAAEASLPPVIRADRDYQIAAAYFYSGNWDEAEKRFRQIAGDVSSPWRATAAMVAARCQIRAATLGTDDPVERQRNYVAADAQLKKIIADPAFSSVKAGAERLRGYVEFRLDPDARLVELSNVIEQRSTPENIAVNLDDYSKLIKKPLTPAKLASLREQSAMTDWIFSFEGRGETEDKRITSWQKSRSLAWLVAALTYAQADTPQLAELLDAAAKVPATSPAYLTVAFHRDRLLAAGGKPDQARPDLDKVLKMPQDRMPPSARNLFLALRMKAARNLDEFLEFAPRQASEVAAISVDCATVPCAPSAVPQFDADAAMGLTQSIPTQLLARAAASPRLLETLRREIAEAAWTRAIMLNQDEVARSIVPALSVLEPDLAAGLNTYNGAPSASDRGFAGVFLILHRPGLRPYVNAGAAREAPSGKVDSFRENWWCTFATPSAGGMNGSQNYYTMYGLGGPLSLIYTGGKLTAPQFMTDQDRQVAEKEWTSMLQLGGGPTWLLQRVLDWAKAHPSDPRVPEALHLAVNTARVGCTDPNTGDYSEQAFTLLHSRYPNNEWTARTIYWYK